MLLQIIRKCRGPVKTFKIAIRFTDVDCNRSFAQIKCLCRGKLLNGATNERARERRAHGAKIIRSVFPCVEDLHRTW